MTPILIGTYTRLSHLKQTVSALQENYHADQTDLYIASDFPKCSDDVKLVEELRAYVDSITGFSSVNKIYRERNYGASDNFTDASNLILKRSNEIIVMEDDIVTGRGFIKFMNDALREFRDDPRVIGVTGYLWPEIEIAGSESILLPAYNAWGWGTWRDRFEEAQLGRELSREVFSNKKFMLRVLATNPNLLPMIRAIAQGKLVAWDVDWNLNAIKFKKFCVFPPLSLVKNIGFDGTGVHCGVDSTFGNQEINRDGVVQVKSKSLIDFNSQGKIIFYGFGGWRNLLRVLLVLIASFLPETILSRMRVMKNLLRLKP